MQNRDISLRMKHAFLELQHRKGGKYTREEFGRDVALRTGRKKPYDYTSAVRWLQGVAPDDIRAMIAIADTLGVNFSWLWTGRGYRYPRREDIEEMEPVTVGGAGFEIPMPLPPITPTTRPPRRHR